MQRLKIKFHRELIARVELARLQEIVVTKIGKHLRLSGSYTGKMLHFILPGTPSDYRNMANQLAEIKRRMRQIEQQHPETAQVTG